MYKENDTTIEFAFPIGAIEQSVYLQSTYGAKNMQATTPGVDIVDAFGLSADEKEFTETQLADALNSLFLLFVGQSEGIENAVTQSKEFEGKECCGFVIKREMNGTEPTYNTNRLKIIDATVADYLKNSILLQWAKTNKIADDVTIYQNAINDNVRIIARQNAEIKKGRYSTTYSIEQV